jgi:hypothetical protein
LFFVSTKVLNLLTLSTLLQPLFLYPISLLLLTHTSLFIPLYPILFFSIISQKYLITLNNLLVSHNNNDATPINISNLTLLYAPTYQLPHLLKRSLNSHHLSSFLSQNDLMLLTSKLLQAMAKTSLL